MKIIIHFAEAEDNEVDKVVEALVNAMPKYYRVNFNDRKDYRGGGHHHVIMIHNGKYPQL